MWQRNDGYWYESRREGGRVRSVYLGRDCSSRVHLALADIRQREFERQDRQEEMDHWDRERERLDALDGQVDEHGSLCKLVATAALLATGHHAPKRQWRKRRMRVTGHGQTPTKTAVAPGKSVVAMTRAEIEDILRRAGSGDRSLAPQVQAILSDAGFADRWGDLTALATQALVDTYLGGKHLVPAAATETKVRQLRANLEGEMPSPVERLLADRCALCWLHLHLAEAWCVQHEGKLSLQQADYHGRRCARLSRQFLDALRTLALVRQLQVPALLVQVNLAARPQVTVVK
jgi:hypothetical protein